MAHPFQDKLIVFIGTPEKCSRQAARDALIAVGGVTDEQITAFSNYAVTFRRAETTQAYQKALKYERNGLLAILSEELFFDILEGTVAPPEMPELGSGVVVIPSKDPEADARESEQAMKNILDRKRMKNLAEHGVPTPDGGRIKADFRPLDMARRVTELMKEDAAQIEHGEMAMEDFTDEDLVEALQAITSMISKCEKALEKLREGTPQYSLTRNRIKALRIAATLINIALEE